MSQISPVIRLILQKSKQKQWPWSIPPSSGAGSRGSYSHKAYSSTRFKSYTDSFCCELQYVTVVTVTQHKLHK